jgi:hypothetical protein
VNSTIYFVVKCFQLDFDQKNLDKFEECNPSFLLLLFLVVMVSSMCAEVEKSRKNKSGIMHWEIDVEDNL